jgi:murein DD-endopeptidase MepM/ murein hydrolase activator NlpD
MSLSSHNRTLNADNPFGIFDAKRPLHRAKAVRHSEFPVTPHLPLSQLPASQQYPQSGRISNKKRLYQTQLLGLLKRLAVLGLFLFVVFTLLPTSFQKRCYALLGLRSIVPVMSEVRVPVPYAYISSPFGPRWGRQHAGIDLAAPYAAPIYAASAGRVVHSGWEAGYGNSVVLDHGHGMQTRYAHCSRLMVSEGESVERGTLIAKVGSTGHSTGPHLHFEVIVNGLRKNPAWYYLFPDSGAAQLAKAGH